MELSDEEIIQVMTMLGDISYSYRQIGNVRRLSQATIEAINNGQMKPKDGLEGIHFPIRLTSTLTNFECATLLHSILTSTRTLEQISVELNMNQRTARRLSQGEQIINRKLIYPLREHWEENIGRIVASGSDIFFIDGSDYLNNQATQKEDNQALDITERIEQGELKAIHDPELDGYYVSKAGEVWSANQRDRSIDPGNAKRLSRYEKEDRNIVKLRKKSGGYVRKRVDRLVLVSFSDNMITPNRWVSHLDGNTRNDAFENLSWSEHRQHVVQKGSRKSARETVKSKTDRVVDLLRKLACEELKPKLPSIFSDAMYSFDSIAEKFHEGLARGIVAETTIPTIFVSRDGRDVYRYRQSSEQDEPRICYMRQCENSDGYMTVHFKEQLGNQSSKTLLVHRLVFAAFSKKKLSKADVIHHIDHNRKNNDFDNLAFMTLRENSWESIEYHEMISRENSESESSGVDLSKIRLCSELLDELQTYRNTHHPTIEIDDISLEINDYLANHIPFCGCIYELQQKINGVFTPVYVGQTIVHPKLRLQAHLCSTSSESLIHAALNSYSSKCFKLTILADNIPRDKLSALEAKYIKEHRTHFTENGYNIYFGSPYTGNVPLNSVQISNDQLEWCYDMLLNSDMELLEIARRLNVSSAYIREINKGLRLYNSAYFEKYPLRKKSKIFDTEYGVATFFKTIELLRETQKTMGEIADITGIHPTIVSQINRGADSYKKLFEKYHLVSPIRIPRTKVGIDTARHLIDRYLQGEQSLECLIIEFNLPSKFVHNLLHGTNIRFKNLLYPLDETKNYTANRERYQQQGTRLLNYSEIFDCHGNPLCQDFREETPFTDPLIR